MLWEQSSRPRSMGSRSPFRKTRGDDALPCPLLHALDGERRAVDHDSVLSRHERRHRTVSVARIALPDAPQKGAQTNTQVLVLQLLIATLGPNLRARFEE